MMVKWMLFLFPCFSVLLSKGAAQQYSYDLLRKSCQPFEPTFPGHSKTNLYQTLHHCRQDNKVIEELNHHVTNLEQTFYFAPSSKSCEVYQGSWCIGDVNLFTSHYSCTKACGIKHFKFKRSSSRNPICQKPEDRGDCFALLPRFYFDRKSLRCKSFLYGGCGGNMNNFKTMDECIAKCEKI